MSSPPKHEDVGTDDCPRCVYYRAHGFPDAFVANFHDRIINSDVERASVGPDGVRLHPVEGEQDNTDDREPDKRGQRALPVQRQDVARQRGWRVRLRSTFCHRS
jgi:hypothetical protein